MRRMLTTAAAVAATIALALSVGACAPRTEWNNPGETADPPKVTITSPADGSADVATAAEIEFTLEGTRTVEVTMADAAGNPVDGGMRDDGSSWIPAQQLDWSTQYAATVKATKSDGSSAEAKTTFTTMGEPNQLVRVSTFNGDHVTYGVGMPIVIDFETIVPEQARAAIQRRLFVTTNPPQEGVWHWISSKYHDLGSQVRYRPKEYWQPGTTVQVRVATGGMSWGYEGMYGGNDLTLDFSIGESMIMTVDNATKQMTVTQNGQVTKTIPVSLGKPSTPSSSGHLLIMSKHDHYTFDTRRESGIPGGGYVTDVDFAERLTTGGEFIHSAPWSVSVQGQRNVSHGCVNMSPANAEFIYTNSKVGDPVIITGTEVTLEWGNGFTDWDRSWDEYVKGSAIPYVPDNAPSPTAS